MIDWNFPPTQNTIVAYDLRAFFFLKTDINF